jgi:hypothetical protein
LNTSLPLALFVVERSRMGLRAKYFRGLHAEASRRGLSHDALHELARSRYGVDSLAKLTDAQLRSWYREICGRGFRHPGVASRAAADAAGKAGRRVASGAPPKVVRMVSGDDLAMLAELAFSIGWTREGLEKFVRRQLSRDAIRTVAEFNRVLWGLKAQARRKGLKV